MGQKVSPIGFRTGIRLDWQSNWFASKSEYGDFLVEDQKIRDYVDQKYNRRMPKGAIGKVETKTAGLVTLEDIIEEIVGEIRDEYDLEKPLVRQVNENTWLVDGKIDIEDLNETLNLKIPAEEDYESLGGFIFSLMGRIPQDNEEVRFEDLLLIVEKVQGQRIRKVRLVRQPSMPEQDNLESD